MIKGKGIKRMTNTTTTTPLSIDSEGLEDFTVGQAKNFTLQASGGKLPYTWSAAGLPPATTLSAAGVISGTPQKAVTGLTVSIKVTDSSQTPATNTRDFSVDVNPA